MSISPSGDRAQQGDRVHVRWQPRDLGLGYVTFVGPWHDRGIYADDVVADDERCELDVTTDEASMVVELRRRAG